MSDAGSDLVAVVGAGAVGTALAGGLAEAGLPVLVCGRTPVDALTVTRESGAQDFPVRWVGDPAQVSPVRWIVLATKIHQTPSALPWLSALTDQGTHVIAAQNGVDHRERLARLPGKVAPALVYLNAERLGPGQARVRNTERGLVLADDPAGQAAARLFEPTWVRTELSADFRTAAWLKLLLNAIANPLTALTGRRVEVLREALMERLVLDVAREVLAVGRAEGAHLSEEHMHQTMRWLHDLPSGSTSSMLQDRIAGRALEYDGITGTIVRLADRHGIEVPANRALLALLGALRPAS